MQWKKDYQPPSDKGKGAYTGPNRSHIHGWTGTTDWYVSCHELRGVDKKYLGPDTLDIEEVQKLAEKVLIKEMKRLASGFSITCEET